jgi:hypothetical protein
MDFHYNAVPIKAQMPEGRTKSKAQMPNKVQNPNDKTKLFTCPSLILSRRQVRLPRPSTEGLAMTPTLQTK